jgi:murein DD-endopeptidase MepM/ murein hydrolase activator NlpD
MRTRSVLLAICFAALGCQHGDGGSSAASAKASASAAPPPPAATPAAAATTTATAAAAATSATPSGSAAAAASAAPDAKPADQGLLTTTNKAIQGALLHAKIGAKVKHISFPGHRTTILEDGEFMIAFARTAPAKEKLTLTLEDGSILEREFTVEQRKYETDKIDGLPKNQVDLDAPTKKKVGQAEAKFDDLRVKFGDSTCFRETFKWPVKGKLTSRYGQPRLLNGTDAGPHWGVDIVAVKGTPVHAPACGKVIVAEKDVPLSGNVIIVDHGRGLSSTFLHLDKLKVKVGDAIKQGQEIGTVGLTGRTNGAHLDWRMNLFDIRIDPELVAPPM